MATKTAAYIFLGVFILCASCSYKGGGTEDPKRRLTDYISKSFAVKGSDDRKILLDYLTGQSKARLTAWSEEQFRQAFMDSKRQFLKLAFKEVKPVSPREMNITYELTYDDQPRPNESGQTAGPRRVTHKKFCQMVLENGHWYIADVRSLKELVEYSNEMALP